MKVAILTIHKNICNIYKKSWIIENINCINNQDYTNFDVFELNYDENEKIKLFKNSFYYNKNFKSHYDAMNYLIEIIKNHKNNYDAMLINNVDDIYSNIKIRRQVEYMLKDKLDLVSSNIKLYQEIKGKKFTRIVDLIPPDYKYDDTFNPAWFIKYKIKQNKKIIENSGVLINRKMFDDLKYEKEFFPFVCEELWKKLLSKNDAKIGILDEYLTNIRIHGNQVINNTRSKEII